MAPSVVTSPVCTPWVSTGRARPASATAGAVSPAAATPAPIPPARNSVRLVTPSLVMGAVLTRAGLRPDQRRLTSG